MYHAFGTSMYQLKNATAFVKNLLANEKLTIYSYMTNVAHVIQSSSNFGKHPNLNKNMQHCIIKMKKRTYLWDFFKIRWLTSNILINTFNCVIGSCH